MDFFESQNKARKKTTLLLFLFTLAVLSLVALTNLLVFALINMQDTAGLATGRYHYSVEIFLMIGAGVISLIILASLFKLYSLKGGGRAVAEMLGGELLVDAGGDLNRKKLLNVVEEMAIASGTPVPPVYLIRESAINAFAAGYSPSDAVIGVTEGAMNNLTRDELQGVIAHEFSHIFNGDMRLNIRLIGVLYGILMLALIGRILLQSGAHRAGRRNNSGSIVAIAVGLLAIGYLGQFFGNLIKAAVSRQREYLADASAVQFTRNPASIANALKRIGGYREGTVLKHPESEEISHAFFCEAVSFSFAGLMATHPPLAKRIRRIEPGWQGDYLEGPLPAPDDNLEPATGAMGFVAADVSIDPEKTIDNIGNPDDGQVGYARKVIGALPPTLTEAARVPYSARSLVYLMILDQDKAVREQQIEHLRQAADLGVFEELEKLLRAEPEFQPGMRLPLLEMALPTLHQLSYEQYRLFLSNLDVLIRADGRIGLSEWAVRKLVTKHLGEVFEGRHSKVKFNRLSQVKAPAATLLSLLAYADRHADITPQKAFELGAVELDIDLQLVDKQSLGFTRLNDALDALAALHPLRKPKLLKACVRTVTADGVVSVLEQELLRMIADTLECPMPPVVT